MVQDYVPARSNLSTGLIVKSHILERNKYERYEPEVEITNNYSESIDLITISGTDPDEIPWSTANTTFSQFIDQPLSNNTGSDVNYIPVEINNDYSWEKYTGEFGGSTLDVVTGDFSQIEASSMTNPGPFFISNCNRYSFILSGSFAGNSYSGSYTDCSGIIQQISFSTAVDTQMNFCSFNTEVSIIKTPAVGFPSLTEYYPIGPCTSSYEIPTVFYNEGATYNNINKSVTSTRFIDAEYSYGIDIPVNMSNIISESSCQNCNRLNCYNLIIDNQSTSSQAFTYQDCNGETYVVSLNQSEASQFCAKSNTLNFLYGAETYLQVQQGGICGATFSNYPYVGNCKYISVCNNSGNDFDISYVECTGVFTTVTIDATTCGAPVCIDPDTLVIGNIFEPPVPIGDYTITDYGFCNYPFPYTLSSFTKYCQFLNTIDIGPYTAYTYEYTTCAGIQESGSGVCNVPFSGSCQIGISKCIRSGSLVITGDAGGNILSGSLSYCGFYEDPTPFTGSRTPVEIQEYNYNRTGALRSKYEGAKSTSAKYNVYTKGDNSYPGYAAIDNYIGYTGLLTNVESSSYFPDQMVVKLAYFSDTSGGLNDLNLQNNNWVYMQNIYKPGSIVTIKQFNATQFSNQYYLDKQFKVVESGYSYQPYWYRSNNDGQECYRSEFAGSGSNQFAYVNYRVSRFPDPEEFIMINLNYPPTASSTSDTSEWPYIPSGSSESDFTGSANTYQLSLFSKKQNFFGSNLVPYYKEVPGSSPGYKYITGSYYNVPEDGVYKVYTKFYYLLDLDAAGIPAGFDIKVSIVKNPSTASGYIDGGIVLDEGSLERDLSGDNNYKSIAEYTGYMQKGDRIYTKTVVEDWKRVKENVIPRGYILSPGIIPDSFYNAFELVSALNSYCIPINTGSINLLFSSSYQTGGNILPMTEVMGRFFNVSGSTEFLPEISSSLYPLLGDVNYTTEIEPGDFIILYYVGSEIGLAGNGDLYPISRRIIDIVKDGDSVKSIQVYPDMLPYITAANINLYEKLVFIKKQPDESIVILQGKKRPGKTSYGFLVPQDINPYILQNINTLQSTIQSQILNF